MPRVLGQKLQSGKYTIKQELGVGGFGITYLAEDDNQQKVVIKTLNETIQKNPDFDKFQKDFEDEAQRLRKCSHPHIVQVYDFFREGFLSYIVLEYIDGENLAEWVDKHGVLSEIEALNYIQQIGEALKVVHTQGLLHRDLKPENIMLRADKSQAVLIDFGIAREFAPNLTVSHTQFISDYYSPIEQYHRRAKRDVYTDIYSLAATLYVILTKELPVPAPVRAAVGTQLQQPKQLNPSISNKVNNAILEGMGLKPSDRPQSIEEWLKSLGIKDTKTTINSTTQIIPNTPHSKKQSLFWFGIGLATALTTVGLGSFGYQKWVIYQEEKVAEEIEKLKINENYVECINKSLEVSKNSHKYEDARAFLNQCASEQLAQAENFLKNKDFKQVIIAAKTIPSETFSYQEAQKLISQASDNLFIQAQNIYEKEGKIEEAISLIQTIPVNIKTEKNATASIAKWRKDWKANEDLFKDAQAAVDKQKWYEVRNTVQKLTTAYWKNKAKSMSKTARDKIAVIEREKKAQQNWKKATQKAYTKKYGEAIYFAKKIPSRTSVYRKAQNMISKWRNKLGLEGFASGKYFYQHKKEKNRYIILQKKGKNIIGQGYYYASDNILCLKGLIKHNVISDVTVAFYDPPDPKKIIASSNPIDLSKWNRLSLSKAHDFTSRSIQECRKEFS